MTITEERRLVSVLFVDLVGFTSRSESADPEDVREIQRAYFAAVSGVVERYGGTVEKYIGDAVMATYGAPVAHDDDAQRALHAAIGIREAVADLDRGLDIRIGVNTGEVVGGAGAGPQAGEYTVTGDAVNVAARLQQAAEPNDILVGATTARLAAHGFRLEPLAPIEVKGKADPVEAWRLLGTADAPRLARGGEAPLVGRTRELRLLEGVLEEAAEGRGLIAGLVGEAGIGKSRLALEIRARAGSNGFATTWASSPSFATSFPYHLIGRLVEELGVGSAELARLAPDPDAADLWTAAVADLRGAASVAEAARLAALTPARRQHVLVQLLRAVLVARAADGPQLLVLDDLHWADASSIAVLDEVLAVVGDHAVAVLALHRPGWDSPWKERPTYQQVNLGALRPEEAEALARSLAVDGSLDDARTAELLHRSGGNPFFLEELVRNAADASGGVALPETLHELLLARIDALEGGARELLQLASVVGMEFGERVLTALEPTADVDLGLATLQRADLVVPRGGDLGDRRFAMRHPLVHEVAYRSLLVARRRELHARIGHWLEEHAGDEALPEIAAHFREGNELDRARELLPRAAERAARLNAPHESAEAYLAAAELFGEDPAARARMLERASAQKFLMAELPAALSLATTARRLYQEAGETVRALDTTRLLGRYAWLDGRGEDAEAEVTAAIEGLEQLPPTPELAMAYSYRSQLAFLRPDYELGEGLARRAIAVADEVGAVEVLPHALNNLGMCRCGQGDPGGLDDVRRSLALAKEHHLVDDALRAYTNLSGQGAAIPFTSLDEAEALYDEMLAYDAEVVPGGSYEQWHRSGRAEMWIATGRWDDAERQLRELALLPAPNRYIRLDVEAFLGLLLAFRGRSEEAVALVRPHVAVAAEIGDLQAYGPVHVALAHALRGTGDADGAAASIRQGLALHGETREHNVSTWCLFEWTDVAGWLRHGRDGDALGVARTALAPFAAALRDLVRRGGTEPELRIRRGLFGAADATLRWLTDDRLDDAGREALVRAATDLRAEHRVFEAARAELWLAEATGDRDARSRAAATFRELRAAPYLERATRA